MTVVTVACLKWRGRVSRALLGYWPQDHGLSRCEDSRAANHSVDWGEKDMQCTWNVRRVRQIARLLVMLVACQSLVACTGHLNDTRICRSGGLLVGKGNESVTSPIKVRDGEEFTLLYIPIQDAGKRVATGSTSSPPSVAASRESGVWSITDHSGAWIEPMTPDGSMPLQAWRAHGVMQGDEKYEGGRVTVEYSTSSGVRDTCRVVLAVEPAEIQEPRVEPDPEPTSDSSEPDVVVEMTGGIQQSESGPDWPICPGRAPLDPIGLLEPQMHEEVKSSVVTLRWRSADLGTGVVAGLAHAVYDVNLRAIATDGSPHWGSWSGRVSLDTPVFRLSDQGALTYSHVFEWEIGILDPVNKCFYTQRGTPSRFDWYPAAPNAPDSPGGAPPGLPCPTGFILTSDGRCIR